MNNVINGRSGISPEMAIRLTKAFGSTAETWLWMQLAYDLAGALKDESKIKVRRQQMPQELQPAPNAQEGGPNSVAKRILDALPHRKVGKHRRILIDDVMAYKNRIDAEREAVLDQLTADAQENDMGYSRRWTV